MAKTFRCETCGVDTPWLGGAKPRYCPAHRPAKNRSRDLRALEQRSPEAAALAKAVAGAQGADQEALRAIAPMLLALGLTVARDAAAAARMMGLGALAQDATALAAIEAEARTHHRALLERRPAALGELGFAAVGALLARVLAGAAEVPPGQIGTLTKALAQTIELVQGGNARPAYTELRLVLPGEKEER